MPHGSPEVLSFWWKDAHRLNVLYRGVPRYLLGDSSTVSFWDDLWSDEILAHKFPVLCSFAKNKDISIKQLMQAEDLHSIFELPLSLPSYEEMMNLEQYLSLIPYSEGANDQWIFLWGNQQYTSSRYYKMVFQNCQAPRIFKIWKSRCTSRLWFFAWLIFVDRLNTKNMLIRRHFNVQPNSSCVMCANMDEEDINTTRNHLICDDF